MRGRTHLAGGLLAGQVVALVMDVDPATPAYPALLAAAALGGLLPDIDCPTASISKATLVTKGVSGITCGIFKHRGFIHTPVFAAIFFLLAYHTTNELLWYVLVGIGAGFISHLILDTFNHTGIMWFWPLFRKRIHFGSVKNGGTGESVCITLLIVANIAAITATILQQLNII